jgi:hypothetical protein
MDRTELLDALRTTHAPIEAAAAAHDDEALSAPAPGLDGWTRKDVLAHLEWCNRYAADVVGGVRTGVDPDPDTDDGSWDVDVENARILEENRDRPAADVREGEVASFQRLLGAVEAATEDELFRPDPQPWLKGTAAEEVEGNSTLHYREHASHLA